MFHFWEGVAYSVESESLKYKDVHGTDVHKDIDDMDVKNNAEVRYIYKYVLLL